VHLRPGGGNGEDERKVNELFVDAANQAGAAAGMVFLGIVRDGIAKEQSFVWSVPLAFIAGEVRYLAAVDYFHDVKSLRNAANCLGAAPPYGGHVWVDFSIFCPCLPVKAIHIDAGGLYSDSL
jgi:hypothetical protein